MLLLPQRRFGTGGGRPQPAPDPRTGPSLPARPRPSLPGRAGPAASPAARARPERARTCGQQCAFGLLADRIWRFCTLQGRLLCPDAFVYEGLGGRPRGQRRSCRFSGTWRRGPLGPFADCCLEAGPLALSLCAPSPRSSRAEQPAWWEGRGRRVGSDPHLRALLGCGAGAPCLVSGEMGPVAPVLGCPCLPRGHSGVGFPGRPQRKGWRL